MIFILKQLRGGMGIERGFVEAENAEKAAEKLGTKIENPHPDTGPGISETRIWYLINKRGCGGWLLKNMKMLEEAPEELIADI